MKKTSGLIVGLLLATAAHACTAPDYTLDSTCNPEAILPSERCAEQLLKADAGTDAESDANESDAELDGSNARAACLDKGGECVPIPSGKNANNWEPPVAVWMGPTSEKPKKCPFDGAIVGEKYAGLHAPPLDCAQCECEKATGDCTGVPDSISVGTTMCTTGGISVPFDGQGGWDGSCTNANAIPAGAQCPPGSGTPCVQSIAWSALPGPQNESCVVKQQPIPGLHGITTSWDEAAVMCDSSLADHLCNDGQQLCVPDVLWPWVQCVWRPGNHENECPDGYAFSSHVFYEDKPIDTRACTECSCAVPTGGECAANFSIFTDSTCTTEIQNQMISSVMFDCDLIFPAGMAIGSKSITDHLYVPGTCAASGGEPIGEAIEDSENATTFCCRPGKIFE